MRLQKGVDGWEAPTEVTLHPSSHHPKDSWGTTHTNTHTYRHTNIHIKYEHSVKRQQESKRKDVRKKRTGGTIHRELHQAETPSSTAPNHAIVPTGTSHSALLLYSHVVSGVVEKGERPSDADRSRFVSWHGQLSGSERKVCTPSTS